MEYMKHLDVFYVTYSFSKANTKEFSTLILDKKKIRTSNKLKENVYGEINKNKHNGSITTNLFRKFCCLN